jgi:hypothetical protein
MSRDDDITGTFQIPRPEEVKTLSSNDKLQLIELRMLKALKNRVQRCRTEANVLACDMEVVNERLGQNGHAAKIGSVRVAGFHIAQTELTVLTKAYNMITGIIRGTDVEMEEAEEES